MDGKITTVPTTLPPEVYSAASNSPLIQSTSSFISSPQSIHSPIANPARAKRIDSIGSMAFASTAPNTPWDVAAHEKAQYDSYFSRLDKQQRGLIQGTEVVEFLRNSKLPQSDLAKIWDLADINNRGALNPSEFAVAMHLVHKRLAGEPLPAILPKSLVPPTTPIIPPSTPLLTSTENSQPTNKQGKLIRPFILSPLFPEGIPYGSAY